MDFKDLYFIFSFFVSLALLVLAFWLTFFAKQNKMGNRKGAYKSGGSKVLLFSILLFFSIWSLRFAAGYCSAEVPKEGLPPSFLLEEAVSSFFLSLRTFGIEEEYFSWLSGIKKIISEMIATPAGATVETVVVAYVSFLDVVAPFAGGAIILEFLTTMFPKFQLRLSYLKFWKKRYYYFNELNDASLAMAKSIYEEKRGERLVLVFADSHPDREDEKEYDRYLEAKRYGAICLRDDLVHIPKTGRGIREYFLMYEDEFSNIGSLIGLMEKQNARFTKDSFIYLFVQSDAYVQIEKQILSEMEKEGSPFDAFNKPRIVPVRGHRNLVHNLLTEIPLYEPLVNKEDREKLSVTILGNGVIGTEAFLSVYWLGQMMYTKGQGENLEMLPCRLNVNVVSKDEEEDFWSKIDYVNPDIRRTVDVAGYGPAVGDLLAYGEKGSRCAPYFSVRYVKSDLKVGEFWNMENESYREALSADYFIVALGNDSDNISIAEKIRSYIGKKHIEDETLRGSKTVIAYAVFDPELVETLNGNKCFSSRSNRDGSFDILMHAFGSLEQVYSCSNVYMSMNKIWAEQTGSIAEQSRFEGSHRMDHVARVGAKSADYDNSNYEYWANLARAMHVRYKVFSLGWITTSIFDCKDGKNHRDAVASACRQFRKMAAVEEGVVLCGRDAQIYSELELKKHCLAWLEHRRWNAFTRIMGYQTVDVEKMLAQGGSHKDMRLKLHSCLVEARLPVIGKAYPDGDFMWLDRTWAEGDDKQDLEALSDYVDGLDGVSLAVSRFRGRNVDYKQYDYHYYGIGEFCLDKRILEKLEKAGIPDAASYCDPALYEETLSVETARGQIHYLPVEGVKHRLGQKYRVVRDRNVKGSFVFENTVYAVATDLWLTRFCDFFRGLFTKDNGTN